MQATPMQLVFGRDAIMNLTFNANRHLIRQQKQGAIHKNNDAKNKEEKNKYKVNNNMLIKKEQSTKFGQGITVPGKF